MPRPVKEWLSQKMIEMDLSESATVNEILKESMKRDKVKAPRTAMPSRD